MEPKSIMRSRFITNCTVINKTNVFSLCAEHYIGYSELYVAPYASGCRHLGWFVLVAWHTGKLPLVFPAITSTHYPGWTQ